MLKTIVDQILGTIAVRLRSTEPFLCFSILFFSEDPFFLVVLVDLEVV